MPFDESVLETNVTVNYNDTEYRVIDTASSGLFIVAKEEDVKNKNYPLSLWAIPSDIY